MTVTGAPKSLNVRNCVIPGYKGSAGEPDGQDECPGSSLLVHGPRYP